MSEMAVGNHYDDPRKLRDMLERAELLARQHELHSTVVGLAAPEGDLLFPELIDFVESALRVDDSIFRMTRERAVLVLADVDCSGAREIVDRLIGDFREQLARLREPELQCGFFEVEPGRQGLTVKQVLPAVFGATVH